MSGQPVTIESLAAEVAVLRARLGALEARNALAAQHLHAAAMALVGQQQQQQQQQMQRPPPAVPPGQYQQQQQQQQIEPPEPWNLGPPGSRGSEQQR
jgi:transcription initiation factor TFIID subunit TAF12